MFQSWQINNLDPHLSFSPSAYTIKKLQAPSEVRPEPTPPLVKKTHKRIRPKAKNKRPPDVKFRLGECQIFNARSKTPKTVQVPHLPRQRELRSTDLCGH